MIHSASLLATGIGDRRRRLGRVVRLVLADQLDDVFQRIGVGLRGRGGRGDRGRRRRFARLRGGKAACWRVAGAIAAVTGTVVFAAAVFLVAALLSVLLPLSALLGTTLRAIGRGFGKGTFALAEASVVQADKPTASARLVARAVDRNAAARMQGVTAFLRGESFKR